MHHCCKFDWADTDNEGGGGEGDNVLLDQSGESLLDQTGATLLQAEG